jgi:phosphatidate cytidylyltransferase
MKRILTALALIPIIVWVVVFAGFWPFLGVLVTVACLCYREYDGIAEGFGFGAPGWLGYPLGLLILFRDDDSVWLLMVLAALVAFVLAMREQDLAKSLPRAALLIAGVVYIFGCWKCAIPLREISPHWLMYGLLLNWVGDIGAYYVGRSLGKHKLAPQVSPKKTWEGAAASLVTSVVVAGIYLTHFVPTVSWPIAIALTAAANAAGQVGDLAESAMKRGSGVKDSGTILPGHGGFLDRVDSTLFALPVIYAWLKFTGS